MTKPNNSEWLKIKEQYKTGLVISIVISFALLVWPGYESKVIESNFIKEKRVLKEKPVFIKKRTGKSASYFVDLVFIEDNRTYKIGGVDYNFLKHKEFIRDLNSGDTVVISRHKESVRYISKNNNEYLDYKNAEPNRSNTILFLGLLFLPIIPICIIVLTYDKHPAYKSGEDIPLQAIVIITLVVTFIMLKTFINFQFIINGEFVN